MDPGLLVSVMKRRGARAVTDSWWRQEQQRQEDRKRQYERIPVQFRGWTGAMLDEQRRQERMMAQNGVKVPSPISQEVENAIRNYEIGSLVTGPVPDRSAYMQMANERTSFLGLLAIGWIAGALIAPIADWATRGAKLDANR